MTDKDRPSCPCASPTSRPRSPRRWPALLRAEGEFVFAEQVLTAEVVDRCRCGEDWCASCYTAPRPLGAYDPALESIDLEPSVGGAVLDVVAGRLMHVEVLHHAAFRRALDAAVP
jgi:hypothetical protein